MQKTAVVPAISDAIALLTNALSEGHTVAISLAAQPRVIRAPPLVTACCLQFGLTPSQARVLVALLEHGYLSRPDLHAAMSSGRGRRRSRPSTSSSTGCGKGWRPTMSRSSPSGGRVTG